MVWNIDQCDDVPAPKGAEEPETREFTPIESAQNIVNGMPSRPKITHRGDRTCYNPATDVVNVPKAERFKSDEEYYATTFHELAHKLVSAGDMLASTIKDEIDPEFSLATIDIGHGFLGQRRYEEAARTILEDLQIIDSRIESPIHTNTANGMKNYILATYPLLQLSMIDKLDR